MEIIDKKEKVQSWKVGLMPVSWNSLVRVAIADCLCVLMFILHLCMLMEQHLPFQVISARKGEFETGFERGGQTREHAMLAKTAGVKHLIVLINKMDDSTVQWAEKRYNECKEKLVPYLKKVSRTGYCGLVNFIVLFKF